MKKRTLIIESVVFLAVTVLALTTVTFAWFVSSRSAKVRPFSVSVTGVVPLSVAFFRGDASGENYVEVPASDGSPFRLVGEPGKGEMLVPGQNVYCRMDVTNGGDRSAGLTVDFTDCTYLFTPADDSVSVEDALSVLSKNLVLGVAVTDSTSAAAPPDAAAYTEGEFVSSMTGAGPYTVRLLPTGAAQATIGPGQTVLVWYRYTLKPAFDLLGVFDFSAAGMRLTAV